MPYMSEKKKHKTFRIRESYYKKLEVLCVALDKKPQEIIEIGVMNYLDELEEQYIKSVIDRKKAI